MFYPNWRQEKKLRKSGYDLIAGADEAGRGAWAGPIVAAAVILDPKTKIKGIKDSKLLRSPERKSLFQEITSLAVAWSVASIKEGVIDQIGLNNANILVIKQALENLKISPNFCLIDGALKLKLDWNFRNIVDGDYKVKSIAAASIIAKVTRDQIMDDLDESFPQWGFKQHKGYGTPGHYEMLIKYGPSQIHRQSFEPVKYLIEK